MILIITNKSDIHVNPVIDHLNKNKVGFFRLNTDALLTDYEIECSFLPQFEFSIFYKQNGLTITQKSISAIWDRRPVCPESLLFDVDEPYKQMALNEGYEFLYWLRYSFTNIFMIGSPLNDRQSSSKIYQYIVADELGLSIPKTIFSNSPKFIDRFSSSLDQLAIKPIEVDSLEVDDLEYAFFVKKINSKEIIKNHEDEKAITVSFIQEYIEKKYELRVTIVCDEVFPVKINSQNMTEDNGKIDWRQSYNSKVVYEIYELPDEIKNKCILYLQRMNICFGCFDFIVTNDNKYIFLECNSNGQWYWLEEETEIPISEAIARRLTQGK